MASFKPTQPHGECKQTIDGAIDESSMEQKFRESDMIIYMYMKNLEIWKPATGLMAEGRQMQIKFEIFKIKTFCYV